MLHKIGKQKTYINDPADFKMPYLVYGRCDLERMYERYQRLKKVSFPHKQRLGFFSKDIGVI